MESATKTSLDEDLNSLEKTVQETLEDGRARQLALQGLADTLKKYQEWNWLHHYDGDPGLYDLGRIALEAAAPFLEDKP